MTLRSTHDIVKEYNTVVTANLPNIQKLGLMRYESQNFVRNVIKLSVPGNSQKEIDHVNEGIAKAKGNFNKIEEDFYKRVA